MEEEEGLQGQLGPRLKETSKAKSLTGGGAGGGGGGGGAGGGAGGGIYCSVENGGGEDAHIGNVNSGQHGAAENENGLGLTQGDRTCLRSK